LSGRGLCDELITRPEESYRLCCVVVCDLETSRMGASYIYDIRHLRVKDPWHQSAVGEWKQHTSDSLHLSSGTSAEIWCSVRDSVIEFRINLKSLYILIHVGK